MSVAFARNRGSQVHRRDDARRPRCPSRVPLPSLEGPSGVLPELAALRAGPWGPGPWVGVRVGVWVVLRQAEQRAGLATGPGGQRTCRAPAGRRPARCVPGNIPVREDRVWKPSSDWHRNQTLAAGATQTLESDMKRNFESSFFERLPKCSTYYLRVWYRMEIDERRPQ